MNQMTSAMMELANMDELSKLDSLVHRRLSLVKLTLTIQMRGFTGSFYYARKQKTGKADYLWLMGWLLVFIVFRGTNVSVLLGSLFVR